MFDFLRHFLGKESEGSKEAAKERLQLILVHDRADVSPQLIETLKEDLLQVISKYMEIDDRGFDVNLRRSESSVALVANIPVRKLKRIAEHSKVD